MFAKHLNSYCHYYTYYFNFKLFQIKDILSDTLTVGVCIFPFSTTEFWRTCLLIYDSKSPNEASPFVSCNFFNKK